jgi:hypothetical protein
MRIGNMMCEGSSKYILLNHAAKAIGPVKA